MKEYHHGIPVNGDKNQNLILSHESFSSFMVVSFDIGQVNEGKITIEYYKKRIHLKSIPICPPKTF